MNNKEHPEPLFYVDWLDDDGWGNGGWAVNETKTGYGYGLFETLEEAEEECERLNKRD